MTEIILKATHEGEFFIGDKELIAAVLEDGTRLLSEREVTKALGGKRGGSHWKRKKAGELGAELPVYLSATNLQAFIQPDLRVALSNPVLYLPKGGGGVAHGLEAELFPRVLNVILNARREGKLTSSQEPIAKQAEILMGGLATIGIIALVDEATGYDSVRQEALSEILQKYISDHLLEWAKTFPNEFYQELFRLRGWDYQKLATKRPPLTGKLTRDIVYERLPEGVLEELERKNPKTDKGYRKHKFHQWLSEDWGHPMLRAHIYALIGMMRGASNWRQFYNQLERSFPKARSTRMLPFDDEANSIGGEKFVPAVDRIDVKISRQLNPKNSVSNNLKSNSKQAAPRNGDNKDGKSKGGP